MAAHRWRRVISSVVNACIEGSLALDPVAYEAFHRVTALDALETETIGIARTAYRVAAQGGRPAATALQLVTGS